jgi:plasmid maintenance system killer protein
MIKKKKRLTPINPAKQQKKCIIRPINNFFWKKLQYKKLNSIKSNDYWHSYFCGEKFKKKWRKKQCIRTPREIIIRIREMREKLFKCFVFLFGKSRRLSKSSIDISIVIKF